MMERPPQPPSKRGKVVRAAALKPLNVLTLIAGLGIAITTLTWWILILTLATYAALVFLAAKDPVFERRVVEGKRAEPIGAPSRDIPPERRARWLPRGETRESVEDALVTYRKVIIAIEESDDVTRQVLEGSIPRLHEAAERLVDVAANREKAAETLRDFRGRRTPEDEPQREGSLRELERHIEKADGEISGISEQLLTLRAQAVRASMDSAGAATRAASLNASLDELNFRLEAVNETFSDTSQ
ncbi:MAG: hypothetical protein H0U65_14070 [Rubrobacter sp.]|jgi:hypothetical protein|nr:hypothetical protein [Rubrobacter sp.]